MRSASGSRGSAGRVGALSAAAAIAAALAMGGTGAASAATIAAYPGPPWEGGKVLYQAAPGEQNDVVVEREYDRDPVAGVFDLGFIVTISDAGAVITAGAGCDPVDAHTARCRSDADFAPADVRLGDGDDRMRTVPSYVQRRGVFVVVVADGGPDDDVLDVRGGIATGILDGGGGRDRLYGGWSPDVLTDGDRDGAAGDAGPGPDVLDAGAGLGDTVGGDVLSYHQRTNPVSVDLAGGPAGERGEGDTIAGFESVIGGAGDDRLAGSERPNSISGGRGHDILIGRGGDDHFGAFAGLVVGEGTIDRSVRTAATGARGDDVTCGRGADEVNLPSAATVLDATCEDVWVPRKLPVDLGGRAAQRLPAYPSRVRAALTYTVGCSSEQDFDEPGWAKLRCAGEVMLRQAAGRRRLLASGTIPRGRLTLTARMTLTATGRRLATRPRGVRAVLHIRGQNLPDARWTIQLQLARP